MKMKRVQVRRRKSESSSTCCPVSISIQGRGKSGIFLYTRQGQNALGYITLTLDSGC